MGSIGWTEILVIALIGVVLFGGRRLADAGRGLGEAIRNFREGMRGDLTPANRRATTRTVTATNADGPHGAELKRALARCSPDSVRQSDAPKAICSDPTVPSGTLTRDLRREISAPFHRMA
jgi:sec-independent protein translocase protein TatA